MKPVSITLESLPDYEQYVVTWFASVAIQYLLNKDIHGLAIDARKYKLNVLSKLYDKAKDYLEHLAYDLNVNVCTIRSPIPLTPNDKAELFNLCKALGMLEEATHGKISMYPLPPALSFEFAEYVRTYMPKVKESTLKRNVVTVSSDVLALSVIGAYISQVYVVNDEYGYSFVSTYDPKAVDIAKLNGMAKSVTKAVLNGDGSRISLLIGIASAIVLNVGKGLYENRGRSIYSSVRIVSTGKKTMLKAYETIDLTDLAKTIMKLGIASALYNLIIAYPRKEDTKKDKRARTLRSVIEEVSKAILKYYLYRDSLEIYRVLRFITTPTTSSELYSYLSDEKREALDKFLEVRI